MASLLFRLSGVPDDEAQDIRVLLEENTIRFYETDAGFWRVGVDAIWLPDESQLEQARTLIDTYQQQRVEHQQQVYAVLQEQGAAPGLREKFAAQPFRVIGLVVAILFVLALSLIPFLMLLTWS
jgi:hypothetical protein